ncbi:MAG: 4'-phosphopantetheinyl transferase superfamily protein [Candidatus Omnitrophica bacterium]|nr:4'-phosphopantetheinyl transferase superfamily protein [Candidatus Omnitrophota bacterium]
MINAQSECICVEKLKKIIENPSKLCAFFTSREIAYCNNYKDKYTRLAGTLAAKIAFIKAASKLGLVAKKIEVRRKKSGKPFILTDNKILKDYSISVSISHTKSVAVAYCVITKNGKVLSTRKKKG